MATIDYYASTVHELNNAILWSGKGGGADNGFADNHVIHITAGVHINLTQELYAINLAAGDTLTINGNGATIDGGNWTRGFFVYNGTVAINDLTIANTVATGGNGGSGMSGGGGGAGLGGALFIAGTNVANAGNGYLETGGNVSISNVHFVNNHAAGGNGGAEVSAVTYTGDSRIPISGPKEFGGGGGGMGGDGGNAGLETRIIFTGYTGAGGGGGGIGLNADGGNGGEAGSHWHPAPLDGDPGGNGIVPGAASAATFFYLKEQGDTAGDGGDPGDWGGGGGGGGYAGRLAFANAGGGGVQRNDPGVQTLNKGSGGFGGGGGGGINSFATGGFGGGGASGNAGGFGGGGSGLGNGQNGGFGGGAGGLGEGSATENAGGGGGLGAGGAIFVQRGGSLTILGSTDTTGGSVAGGSGQDGGAGGYAYGSGLFIEGMNTLTFAPDLGQAQTINGTIADEAGTGLVQTVTINEVGRLAMNGLGTLTLNGHNAYTGGILLNAGRVELGDSTAAGIRVGSFHSYDYNSAALIRFAANAAATLQIDLAAYPTNNIMGFNADDVLNLKDFGNGATTSFNTSTRVLTVSNGTITKTFNLDPTVIYPASTVFRAASDGQGGVNLFMMGSAPAANLLVDGDFQLIDLTSTGLGVHYEPTRGNYFHGSPYGWTGSGAQDTFGAQLPTGDASPAFAGSKVVFLESGSTISQSFAAPAKYASYKVDLDLSSRLDIGQFTTVKVQIYAGTQLVGEQTFDTTSTGLGNAGHFSVTTSDLAAAGLLGQHITVSVTNTGGTQVFVDNVVASGLNLQGGAAPGTAGNLLADGNFEQVNLGDFGAGVTLSGGGNYTNAVPTGWTGSTGSVGAYQPTYTVAPGMGASVVGVVNGFSSMSQTFAAPGLYNTYQFSLDIADRADGGAAPAYGTIRIYAGSTLIGEQVYDTSTAGPGSAQHVVINTNALNGEPLFSQHLFRQNLTITVSNTSNGQLLFDNVIATGLNLLTQTAPTIAPITSQTIEATGASGAAAILSATATDNIDKNAPVIFKENGSTVTSGTFSIGTHSIAASATNSGNLTSSTSFQIVVRDTTAPTLNAISNIVQKATGSTGATVAFAASAIDIVDTNVAIAFTENGSARSSGDTFSLGTHTITATATDDYGNFSIKTFSILVQDTTAPSFTVSDQVVEATAANGMVFTAPAIATDAVSGSVPIVYKEGAATLILNQPLGLGVHQITATATDGAGLTTTRTFSFTVRDTTAPVLSFTNLIREATGATGAQVSFAATASDTVDGARAISFTENGNAVTPGQFFLIGDHTIHAVVSDSRGNTAVQDFTITVGDTTAPTLSLSNLTREATGANGAAVTFATDANDTVDGLRAITFTENGNAVASGQAFSIGSHTIHAVVSDSRGNTAAQDFTIAVRDTTAPSLTTQQNISKQAVSPAGATATFAVTASDAVDGQGAVEFKEGSTVVHSGGMFGTGTHVIVASSTDAYGNTGTTTFTITIEPNTAPTLGPAPNVIVEAAGADGRIATFSVTANDVVDGYVAVTYHVENGNLVASGDLFSIGTHVITVTATDSYPLTATKTFVINVRDTTGPSLSQQANVIVSSADGTGASATFAVTATDIVDGSRTVVFTDNGAVVRSGDVFSVGTHTITATAQDERGNTSSETFKILVLNTGTVTTAAQFSDAIRVIDEASQSTGGTGTHYVIDIAPGVTLLTIADIWAVNLRGTDTLTINANGAVLDGNNAHRGLFVYSGHVDISDLTIQSTVAKGGDGWRSDQDLPGAGAAGLGGGLFVANDAAHGMSPGSARLNNVSFVDNKAIGGNGATWGGGFGVYGGGGMGGDAVVGTGGAGVLGASFNFGAGTDGDPFAPATPGPFGGGAGGYRYAGYGGGGGYPDDSLSAGFGAGIGTWEGAGGGLGAGGNIFVMEGASLTISGGSISDGSAIAGATATPFGTWSALFIAHAFGDAIFLQGNAGITFAPASGVAQTISQVIADEKGSGGAPGNQHVSGLGLDGSGKLILDGAGTLTLSAQNTYTGTTTVKAGTLLVDGSIAKSAVTVKDGGTLGGHGTTGAVTVEAGGTFAAGNSPGQITVASLNLAAGATFAEELGGTMAGVTYDQTVVQAGGTIALNGAILSVTFVNGYSPRAGDVYKIIDGPGTAISGLFKDTLGNSLAEGARFFVGSTELHVSYVNGDVTLTDRDVSVSSIAAVGGNPNNATRDEFTVTFSKSVTGVDLADFSLVTTGSVAGTLTSVTAVNAYTYTVTVNGVGGAGTLRLDLNSADTGITSLAGDAITGGLAGERFTVDTVSPRLTITSDVSQLKAGETALITFAFDKDPGASFADGDIVVSGGTLSDISGTGLTRTAFFTPTPDINSGTATIEVAAGAYNDALGNTGLAAAHSLTFDTLPPAAPTIDLDPVSDTGLSDSGLGTYSTNDRTLTFTGAGEEDTTVTLYTSTWDGVLTARGSAVVTGGVWSVTTDQLAGDRDYTFYAQSSDAAGNIGHRSSEVNVSVRLSVGPPSAGFLENDGIEDGVSNLFELQIQRTEFGQDHMEFSANGGPWTRVTSRLLIDGGWADGSYAMQLRAVDRAGNVSRALDLPEITLDWHAPALTITSDAALVGGAGTLVTFTFTEDPGASFTANDIVVTGGTLGPISGTGLARTAFFTPTPDIASGTATIEVAEGAYTDQATNAGTAASLNLPFDSLLPVASTPDLDTASDTGHFNDDNITRDTTPTFTGTAEDGATVTLYADGAAVGSAVVSGGVWSITTTELVDGEYAMTAQAVDAAGNVGAISAPLQVTIDTVGPSQPGLFEMWEFATGAPDTDGITNGFAFAAQQSAGDYLLHLNGQFISSWPAFRFDGSDDGFYTFTIYNVDMAGNVGASFTRSFTIDTHSPSLAITSDVAPVGVAGAVITFAFSEDPGESSGDDDIAVSGGTLGPITGTGLTRTAIFTPPPNEAAGTASISVAAGRYTDAALNPGGAGRLSLAIDTVAPDAPSAPDLAAASDSGKSNTDNVTNVKTSTFTGTAEDGATVRLYDGNMLLGTAVATAGVWSITTVTLSDGAYAITATATDAAGNVSTASTDLTVMIDTTPPAAPVLALTHDTGVSGADRITSNPAITYSGANTSYQVDGGGFSSAAPVFATDGTDDGRHTVTVQDQDIAGNISISSLTFVLDTSPPVARDGAASGAADPTITGSLVATDEVSTSLAFSRVAQAAHGTVTVSADGTFSYTPDAFFTGIDSFSFKANDGVFDSNVATVNLAITAPHLVGTPGPDTFDALPGTEFIDALGGIDTVSFNFRLTDATVTYAGNKVIIDSATSHTVLSGFEVYRFTDGTVNNNDGDWLVDDLFYYAQNHDVWNAHADADAHYHATGWHEGRDPSAFFSTQVYLSANPDVRAADADPLIHFDQNGWWEGRNPSLAFDARAYLVANPDVAAAHVDPLWHFQAFGAGEGRAPFVPGKPIAPDGFDFVYYLQQNPDVAAANVDPFAHFMTVGWTEGRNPNALFDTRGYLAAYTDVAAAHINPLTHYNQSGWLEGRDPSPGFDTTEYLSHYHDVADAKINPLTHFLQYGMPEGRSAFADGVWG